MLGQRIAALRREAHMSQADLARELMISPGAVGMYEQGRRQPSGELLVQIARVLGVTTDYLLTGETQTGAETERVVRILLQRLEEIDKRLEQRGERPFSRQELAILLAAVLMEP